MSPKTNAASLPATTVEAAYTTGSVISRDGVTIGYRQLGTGPGLVVVHGAMESAQSHMQLATALADAFTVYVVDRRGRGLSGPYGQAYTAQEDVDDLDAILSQTGAHGVFGVSSGAIICLRAALSLPAIHRLALYEPALVQSPKQIKAVLTRFDQELAQGKTADAMVTAMKGAQMGPPIFNLMPRWLLARLTTMAMAAEAKSAKPGEVTMGILGPTLHYDFALIAETSGKEEMFRSVRQETLLLGGSASPAYLKQAVRTLAGILPHARRVEFPGLDHGGSSDLSATNRHGNPAVVAQEILRFFA
ncbi:MAG TPA: alpha/beta hydrolase [Ktedonobacterales bacterium]